MNLEPEDHVVVMAASAGDGMMSSANESAGGPALRSPACKIGARRDVRLLGGVYLWYRPHILAMTADRRTGISH